MWPPYIRVPSMDRGRPAVHPSPHRHLQQPSGTACGGKKAWPATRLQPWLLFENEKYQSRGNWAFWKRMPRLVGGKVTRVEQRWASSGWDDDRCASPCAAALPLSLALWLVLLVLVMGALRLVG